MRLCVLGGLLPQASLFCVKSEVDGLRRRLSFLFLFSHSIVRERVKLNEKCVKLLLRNVMRPVSRVKKANKCPHVSLPRQVPRFLHERGIIHKRRLISAGRGLHRQCSLSCISFYKKKESCTEISIGISSFSYLNGERVCRMHFYAKTRDFRVEIAITACAIATSAKGMFLACFMFAVSYKPAFVAEIDK